MYFFLLGLLTFFVVVGMVSLDKGLRILDKRNQEIIDRLDKIIEQNERQ